MLVCASVISLQGATSPDGIKFLNQSEAKLVRMNSQSGMRRRVGYLNKIDPIMKGEREMDNRYVANNYNHSNGIMHQR